MGSKLYSICTYFIYFAGVIPTVEGYDYLRLVDPSILGQGAESLETDYHNKSDQLGQTRPPSPDHVLRFVRKDGARCSSADNWKTESN